MQFLVDPASVSLGPRAYAAWIALVVLVVVLPGLAIWQHRRLGSGPLNLPRMQVYASGMTTHIVLVLLSALVALQQGWLGDLPAVPSGRDWVIGAIALALGLLLLIERFRFTDPFARERGRLIAPRTRREFVFFYALAVSAGIAEQAAYRGVLFALLSAMLVGSWWLAAIVAAAAFGVAHLFQGWRAVAATMVIGLRDQIVIGLTGTLIVAIVVHILHDAIAGTVIGRTARREEEAALAIS